MVESPDNTFDTCVVNMLGYPGMGKRTVGGHLAQLIDGVLVDNAVINRPVLELFRWDGVEQLPPGVWDYVRVALRKGPDPEGYRGYTLATTLHQPPTSELIHIDTSATPPAENAMVILNELRNRGFVSAHASTTLDE